MELKYLRLDFEALFSQLVYGHGYLHYGYWPDGKPATPSLMALGEAQQAYFEKLSGHIPDDVKTILDVGSGTGSNARALLDKGFEIECVCPSSRLNAIAAEKLKGEAEIHEVMFEDFSSDKTYDLLMFPESFHYIKLRPAIEQAIKYADKYIIIFDYFRRGESTDENEPRSNYQLFNQVVSGFSDKLEVLIDEDVTEQIAPTFYVMDEINNSYVGPFAKKVKEGLEAEHWFYNKLFNLFLGKAYRKLLKPSRRYETFAQQNEYRFILLKVK